MVVVVVVVGSKVKKVLWSEAMLKAKRDKARKARKAKQDTSR